MSRGTIYSLVLFLLFLIEDFFKEFSLRVYVHDIANELNEQELIKELGSVG